MKTKKKIWSIVLAICMSLGAFSACGQDMGDIIPQTYGAWENHYIYRGNGRSKTTGEDYERLVEAVIIDDSYCRVRSCEDFEIRGEDLYMILSCEKPRNSQSFYREMYCLVRYDIKDKTQTAVFTDSDVRIGELDYFYRPYEIEEIAEDYIVLYGEQTAPSGASNDKYFVLAMDGSVIEPRLEVPVDWQRVSEEYFVAETNNGLYYGTGYLSEPILVYKKDARLMDWTYVEKNGVKGIVIEKYHRASNNAYGEYRYYGSIQFYNLETNTMSAPISLNTYARFYGNMDYVKTYQYKQIEYVEALHEKKTGNVETENMLYRIVYDENGIYLEEMFDLTEERRYAILGVLEDKIVYRELWYKNWTGCRFGGTESNYYQHDVTTDKKTEINLEEANALEDEYAAYYERQKGVTAGQYTYFLHKEEIFEGLMAGNSDAYLLKRYNAETQEIEVMQLWHEEGAKDSSNANYCEALWFTCEQFGGYDFSKFTVLPY